MKLYYCCIISGKIKNAFKKNSQKMGWGDSSLVEHWLVFQRSEIQFPTSTKKLATVCHSRSRKSDILIHLGKIKMPIKFQK